LSVIDIREINFNAAKEKAGIIAVCFDKDNTLTLPYEDNINPLIRNALGECVRTFGEANVTVLSNSAGCSDDAPEYNNAARLEQALCGIKVIRHGSKVCDTMIY
jgi:phosphatidylglycerophosphatase GEP4